MSAANYVYVGRQAPAHRSIASGGSFVGLGAFTRGGYTASYYADAGTLRFDDRNIKNFYEAIRNFDIDLQRTTYSFSRWLEKNKVYDNIQWWTAGKVKKRDLKRAVILRSPTWGLALALEVFAGKRPLDGAFKDAMFKAQSEMMDARSALAILSSLSGLVAVICFFIPGANAIVTPFLSWLSGVTGVLTALTFVLEPVFESLATGKAPGRKDFFDAIKAACFLVGQEPPPDVVLDSMFFAMEKTIELNPAWRDMKPSSDAVDLMERVWPWMANLRKAEEARARDARAQELTEQERKKASELARARQRKATIMKASMDAAASNYDPPPKVKDPATAGNPALVAKRQIMAESRKQYDETWAKQKKRSDDVLEKKKLAPPDIPLVPTLAAAAVAGVVVALLLRKK